jgi:hypothetical protein
MNSLSIGHARRWRRFAGLFALLLVLAGIIPANAISSAGIVNPTFGMDYKCNLTGWTKTGSVSASMAGHCGANLSATAPAGSSTPNVATLEQRFLVSAASPQLGFYLTPGSNNPGTAYAAQTVALYNSAGQLIYQKSRNTAIVDSETVNYVFLYNLNAYANQYVTLRITTQVQPSITGSPTLVGLSVSFYDPHDSSGDPDPGSGGTGVW